MQVTGTHYIIKGRNYERVSTVTKPFYQMDYTPSDWDFYLNRGTAVHQACHLWLTGGLTDESKLHDEIKPFFLAFLAFWSDIKPELIDSEKYLVSEKYGYAGQADILAYLDKARSVIDLKTGSGNRPKKATAIQTAGYANAWQEMDDDPSHILRMGVLLRGDGTYRTDIYSGLKEDFNAFLTLLSAERLKERYTG